MKKIFLASIILGTVTSAAIATPLISVPIIEIFGDTQPVKIEELPAAVKKTLTEKYEGWNPTAAFLVTGENEFYKIELAKGEEKGITKITRDGVVVGEVAGYYDLQSETPIKVENLPELVKKAIAEKFEGWTPSAASIVTGEKEHYKVELTKENDKKLVKFDKDGTIIE